MLHSGLSLSQFVTARVYQLLNWVRLTGWGNLDPAILTILLGFDPDIVHSRPDASGSVGFTFNPDMVRKRRRDADLSDMATVFTAKNAAKLADCGISIHHPDLAADQGSEDLAIAAFFDGKAKIDASFLRASVASDDSFFTRPDDVN